MIRYVVLVREVEFNSLEEAKKAYPGMTLDAELNGEPVRLSGQYFYGYEDGVEPWEDERMRKNENESAERWAHAYMNERKNYYYFHNLYGYAREMWVELEETDENWNYIPVSGYSVPCKESNWEAFQQQLKEEEEALKNK